MGERVQEDGDWADSSSGPHCWPSLAFNLAHQKLKPPRVLKQKRKSHRSLLIQRPGYKGLIFAIKQGSEEGSLKRGVHAVSCRLYSSVEKCVCQSYSNTLRKIKGAGQRVGRVEMCISREVKGRLDMKAWGKPG
jgi:hypothetical protein